MAQFFSRFRNVFGNLFGNIGKAIWIKINGKIPNTMDCLKKIDSSNQDSCNE